MQMSELNNGAPSVHAPQMTGSLVSVSWNADHVKMLDQRLLPEVIEFLELTTAEQVWESIRNLTVRGAPAIGISAAFGVYLGIRQLAVEDRSALATEVIKVADYLATSRPTAVNLFWALDRMKRRAGELAAESGDIAAMKEALLEEAKQIQAEDEETCRMIGEHALTLFTDGMGVLTHCNAGGLATAKYGTALAPMYLAQERGMKLKVFADETRPVLQGARLTAFELQQAGVDVTLICDNMAGMVMSKGWGGIARLLARAGRRNRALRITTPAW